MKTTNYSENANPGVPKPRSFSQTTAAPRMAGGATSLSMSRGTTAAGGKAKMGPLSVPRSGCCGK